MSPEAELWRRVSPLSVVFFLLQAIRAVVKNAAQMMFPAVAVMATTGGFSVDRIYMFGGLILAVVALYSFAAYLNLRYCFTDKAVLIRSGVFQKKHLTVEYGRIQALNVAQNPLYRVFKVIDLKLDSPGSASQEGNLPAVRPAVADELRDLIAKAAPVVPNAEQELPDQDDQGEALLKLSPAEILRSGITSNRALVFLAVLGSAYGTMHDQFERIVMSQVQKIWFLRDLDTYSTTKVVLIIIGLAASVVLLLILLSILGAFIKHHNFTLRKSDKRFSAKAGLITVRTHALSRDKIQLVRIWRGVIHRWLGCTELRARQATAHAKSGSSDFEIPIATEDDCEQLVQAFFGEEASGFDNNPDSERFSPIDRRYISSRIRLIGLLPILLMIPVLIIGEAHWTVTLVPFVWLAMVSVLVWLRFKRWGVQRFGGGIAVRRGLLGKQVRVFLLRKIHYVTVSQSWFQKRRGLATIKMGTAAGSVTVPYLKLNDAEALADESLETIETATLAWI